MKRWVFILLLLNSLCTYSDPANITVGVIGNAPPFAEVSNTGNGSYFFGFSIDVMNGICKHLKVHCTYRLVDFNSQFSALDDGSVEVLLLAEPYDLTKLNQYAISLPYVVSRVQFVALKDSPIQNGVALQHFKIGVVRATYHDLLKKSSYGKNNEIVPFDSITDSIAGLTTHKVDLILINSAIAFTYMTNDMYNIKSVSTEIQLGQGYGIIALPAHAELIKSINKAILSMQMDGTYLSIFKKYYNQEKQLPQ